MTGSGRRIALSLFSIAVAGCLASAAHAGGTTVAVAATAEGIWVTTGSDVVELDPRSAQVERRVLTAGQSPLELGLSDGNVWVSSVEGGYTASAVTRIPWPSGKASRPLVLPSQPVYSLAVGSGTTWALVGPWGSTRLAAIDQATRRTTFHSIHRVGWLAADETGQTRGLFAVTTTGRAIRVNVDGTRAWTADTGRIESPVTVGLGSVWAASREALYRLDPRTGQVEAKIPIASAAATLAVGGGRVWMIAFRETPAGEQYELIDVDPRHERVAAKAPLQGPVGGMSFGDGALWIGQPAAFVNLLRVDPKTLKAKLFATKLDIALP
jgi:outer membrane protein assembly factor BamB